MLKKQFRKLFNENHTVNGLEVEIQLKEGAKLIQQKEGPYRFTYNNRLKKK